jgi:hypothetical protein
LRSYANASNPGERRSQHRRAENDPESGFRQVAARRHSRELAHHELQIVFDPGPPGPQHEMIDYRLAAPVEQFGKGLPAV